MVHQAHPPPVKPNPLEPLRSFARSVTNNINVARQELTSAAVARFSTLLLLHPLDSFKSRVQVTRASSRLAVRASARGPYFAGVPAALLGHVPYGVATFAMFAALKQRLSKREMFNTKNGPRNVTVASAVLADMLASLWLVPWETIKLRVQTGVHCNVFHAIRAGGWYNGFGSQIVRDAPFRAIHMIAYDWCRNEYAKRKGRDIKTSEGIVIGAGVGAIVGGVTTPLDVIKTRVMTQRLGYGSCYEGWLQCFARTVKQEGIGGIFRGGLPRVAYMGVSVALFSLAYEASKKCVEKYTEEKEVAMAHRKKPM